MEVLQLGSALPLALLSWSFLHTGGHGVGPTWGHMGLSRHSCPTLGPLLDTSPTQVPFLKGWESRESKGSRLCQGFGFTYTEQQQLFRVGGLIPEQGRGRPHLTSGWDRGSGACTRSRSQYLLGSVGLCNERAPKAIQLIRIRAQAPSPTTASGLKCQLPPPLCKAYMGLLASASLDLAVEILWSEPVDEKTFFPFFKKRSPQGPSKNSDPVRHQPRQAAATNPREQSRQGG